jgi:hypothetical protein
MTLKKVREKAKEIGLRNVNSYRKEHLIKAIQELEGNSPCFRGISGCQENKCLWREECQ